MKTLLVAVLALAVPGAKGTTNEYEAVIHPGPSDGSGIWNKNAQWFMYAPVFAFKTVDGAVRYRFTVLDDLHEVRMFEADRPTAALVPVWSQLPTGFVTVTCEGMDASGRVVGKAGGRTFWKAAGFREGAYPKAAKSYRDTALGVYRYIFNMKETQYLLRNGRPDASYELNTYVSKMCSSLIRGMLCYGELEPEKRETALAVARAAADHLIRKSEPAGAPLAFFPPTYDGRGEKDNGYIAEKFKGQIMLGYPAGVAQAFLDLAQATGEACYREAAERIAGTYLKLQGADGTWYLKMWAKDGRPVGTNRLVPIQNATPLFERLFALTGKSEYRAAADRSFASLERRLADWNWEGQFEDVVPTARYENLTKHDACSTAIYLAKRFPSDAARRAQVRELLRFAEDQFVCWEPPYKGGRNPAGRKSWASPYDAWMTPCVLEQYNCYVPIDASAAKLIKTYLAAYRLEGRREDLAKARALGDTATRVQCPDGRLPTWWWPNRAKLVYADWINCMMGTAEALLELSSVSGEASRATAAPRFRAAGVLGQSGAVEWTGCAWCAADADGNTHFPGGWMAPKGSRGVRRLPKTVAGTVFSAAGRLYGFRPELGTVFRVKATAGGLVEDGCFTRGVDWRWKLAFRGDGGLLAFDRAKKVVRGWTKDGAAQGTVLDLSAFADVGRVTGLAEHPSSGDILLVTAWPGKVHRFHGTAEVRDDLWPRAGNGTLAVANGKVWLLGAGAGEIADRLVSASQRIRIGNGVAQTTRALAWTGSGWWLATTQGALYCPAAQPSRIAARVGGLEGVGALAVRNGTVYAFAGHVVHALASDDFPDEPFSSSDDGAWCVGGSWSERRVAAARVRDGAIWLKEAKDGGTWRFDPSETEWVRRAHRWKSVTAADGAPDLSDAKTDETEFRGRRITAADLPGNVTALASEGDLLVGYSPRRRAIVRFAPVGENAK